MPKKKKYSLPRIGLRIYKTALSVLACMLLLQLFTYLSTLLPESQHFFFRFLHFLLYRPDPIFACIAAVIVMQPTVEYSLQQSSHRIFGTAVGGAFGLLFLWLDFLLWHRRFNLLVVVAGVIAVIYFCLLIRSSMSVSIAVVTFLIILLTLNEEFPYRYALHRIVDTVAGIGISLGVNLLIRKPKGKGPPVEDVAFPLLGSAIADGNIPETEPSPEADVSSEEDAAPEEDEIT